MTTTAAAPDRAAYQALIAAQRPAGAHSLRLDSVGGVQFAAGDPDLIVGMPVIKPGVFNGHFEVTRDDLDAFVARFNELRGVFRPPMRLDHSWDVMSVIGRFEELRVENLPDPTIGGTVVPYLVADWRLVGTKAQKAELRERMKGPHPHLLERSSEFWPYRTNTGVEYPLVFAGCAFVDVPAVEGLGAFTLRRSHGDTEEGTILTHDGTTPTEGTAIMPEQEQQEHTTDPEAGADAAPTGDQEQAPADPPAPEVDPEQAPTVADPEDDDDQDDDDPEDDPAPAGEEPPNVANLRAALGAAGVDLSADQLRAVETAVQAQVALRREAEERYARHLSRGVIPKAAQEQVRALLSHDDQAVRDGVAAYLDLVHPPVKLRGKDGTQTSEPNPGELTPETATPESARALGYTEFMGLFAKLSHEQRVSPEWENAYAEQVRNRNGRNG